MRNWCAVTGSSGAGAGASPEFWIDPARAPITVSARDGKRLAAALEHYASPEANRAAVKIKNAMHLGDTSTVELAIGEDNARFAGIRGASTVS